MFNASYPASCLPEGDGKGFHVRFPDLPEALTAETTLRIPWYRRRTAWVRPLPAASPAGTRYLRRLRLSAASISLVFRSTLRRKWRYTLPCVNAAYQIPSLPSASG
jgi:hypothetical protein